MRNMLLLVIVTASACAARSPRSTFSAEYNCGDTQMVRDSGAVRMGAAETRLAYSDDVGDHYINLPLAPTDRATTEFVIPVDRKEDAVQREYDTTRGPSTADWRLVQKRTCTARGGYNDVVSRWMAGETIDTVAKELSIDREEAKHAIRQALMSAQTRYWRER